MENMMLSVIIPVYNGENYISKCLNSVLNQTFEDYEIIIINDGSNDRTEYICNKYKDENNRIQVISTQNKGVSSARNIGINMSKGKYIVFIDSDDQIHKDYLRKLVENMKKGGMVTCRWTNSIDDYCINNNQKEISALEAQKLVFCNYGIKGFPFCKIFDREILMRYKIVFDEELSICEDMLFVLEYIKYTYNSIIILEDRLYYYYDNSNGALNSRFNPNVSIKKGDLTEIQAIEKCKDFLYEDLELQKYYNMQIVKSSVVTLRTMCAKKVNDKKMYKDLLMNVRKNALKFLLCNMGAVSSKISVFICVIDPRLELLVWRIRGKHS